MSDLIGTYVRQATSVSMSKSVRSVSAALKRKEIREVWEPADVPHGRAVMVSSGNRSILRHGAVVPGRGRDRRVDQGARAGRAIVTAAGYDVDDAEAGTVDVEPGGSGTAEEDGPALFSASEDDFARKHLHYPYRHQVNDPDRASFRWRAAW